MEIHIIELSEKHNHAWIQIVGEDSVVNVRVDMNEVMYDEACDSVYVSFDNLQLDTHRSGRMINFVDRLFCD
jgi:hypothetical protein